MGAWEKTSRTHVVHMSDGDFFGSEQSHVMPKTGCVRIELVKGGGDTQVLKASTALEAAEVIDSSVIR